MPCRETTLVDVVLYDGVCALCNGFVRFVLARDRAGRIGFAPLQSEVARRALQRHGRRAGDLDTMYLIADYEQPGERVFERSAAVLETCRRLGGVWAWVSVLRLVPGPVRDLVYSLVVRCRYRLFGKYESCPLPPPAWRQRFIDEPGGSLRPLS